MIMGGYSEKIGNSKSVYTIDLGNGKIANLEDLPIGCWSIMPIYLVDNAINLFFQGEETDRLPDHVVYQLN